MISKIKHYFLVISYLHRISLLSFLEYPTGILPLLLAWFLFNLGQFYMINLMITQFRPFPGWGQYEVAFLYGFSLLSESIVVMFFYPAFMIGDYVIEGNFDNFLIKPLAVYPHFITRSINFVSLADLSAALIILIYSLINMPEKFSLLLVIKGIVFMLGAILLRTGFFTLVNSISFWTKKATSFHSICCFMTIRIPKFPLTVLPKLLQTILTFIIPIGFIAYFPASNILDKQLSKKYLGNMGVILGISVLLFMFSVYVFYKGLKRYESAGS